MVRGVAAYCCFHSRKIVGFCLNTEPVEKLLTCLLSELTTDVNIFVDPVSSRQALANKRYFRYLSLDAHDKRSLYAGAM